MLYKTEIVKEKGLESNRIMTVAKRTEVEQEDYNTEGCLRLGLAVIESCFPAKNTDNYEITAKINRHFASNDKFLNMVIDCCETVHVDKLKGWILDANPPLHRDIVRPQPGIHQKI